jgi:hypothetical protein
MAELLMISMLLFTCFCAVILVWSSFYISSKRGLKRPIIVTARQPRHHHRKSRI